MRGGNTTTIEPLNNHGNKALATSTLLNSPYGLAVSPLRRTIFRSSREEVAHAARMHRGSANHSVHHKHAGSRKNSCEWCQKGARDHNWPEDHERRSLSSSGVGPLEEFNLSCSNFSHKECIKEAKRDIYKEHRKA